MEKGFMRDWKNCWHHQSKKILFQKNQKKRIEKIVFVIVYSLFSFFLFDTIFKEINNFLIISN